MIRRLILAAVLLLTVSAAVPAAQLSTPVHAATASAPAQHQAAFFDKTRVIIHLAVAYGVFHHWVYKPWKAGNLNLNHKGNLIKGGLALLFAVHEVRKAINITSKSNSPLLQKLNTLLVGLGNKFQSLGDLFHKSPDTLSNNDVNKGITDLNSGVDQSNKLLNAPDAPLSALGNFG